MLQINIGTTTSRRSVIVEETATPKSVLTDNNIAIDVATVHLDGVALSAKEMNTSFADLGVTESANLVAVVKQANA